MAMNDYMYAVERSDEYLAHYGVKGMKWGVRKALEATGARRQRKLSRAFRKAEKKLEKLERKADSSGLMAKAAKLDKASGVLRKAGRVGLGTAAAATAFSGVGNLGMAFGRNLAARGILKDNYDWKDKINSAFDGAKDGEIKAWRANEHLKRDKVYNDRFDKLDKVDRASTIAQKVGAGVAAAGYGGAIGTKLAANHLRKQATGARHQAAVREAEAWRKEMNRTFKGTGYQAGTSASKKRRRTRG